MKIFLIYTPARPTIIIVTDKECKTAKIVSFPIIAILENNV